MTTLHCMLDESARISKHLAGMIQGDRIILYSEWNDLVTAVSERLKKLGVVPGDRVAIYLAADWRAVTILLGIIRAGAVACPISTRLPRAAVILQLRELGARHVVAVLSGGDRTDLEGIDVLSPDALTKTAEVASSGTLVMDADKPAIILYTSGSSGAPRPAVLTYSNLYYNARGANANLRLASNDRWLLNLPLYHVSGIGVVMRCLLAGATVAIPEPKETLVQAINRYHPSHVSVVPTQLAELLDQPDFDVRPPFKAFLVGGSACPGSLLERAMSRHWPFYVTYGLTEMGSQVTTMPAFAAPAKRIGTAGTLLRHRELSLNESGEILVRGACLFAGYWSDGQVTGATGHDGWFHTGDSGRVDDDGYLVVTGRRDFMIISSGENIQPEEIEMALRDIQGVHDAVVVGVSHPVHGQRPVAFVRADQMNTIFWTEAMSTKLPRFKIPDAYFPWPDELDDPALKPSRAWFIERARKQTA